MSSPTADMPSIKLVSNRDECIRKSLPTFIGIFFGYLIVGVGIFSSCLAFYHNYFFGFSILFSTLALACFLTFTGYSLVKDNFCDYELEITGSEAVFSKIDRLKKSKSKQLVLLSDIKYVEYYPYQDSASIIFHTPYIDLDVPLWPMGSQVQDVIDFLVGAGVKVVDVQSDESIPI